MYLRELFYRQSLRKKNGNIETQNTFSGSPQWSLASILSSSETDWISTWCTLISNPLESAFDFHLLRICSEKCLLGQTKKRKQISREIRRVSISITLEYETSNFITYRISYISITWHPYGVESRLRIVLFDSTTHWIHGMEIFWVAINLARYISQAS